MGRLWSDLGPIKIYLASKWFWRSFGKSCAQLLSPIGGSDRHISCSTKSVAPSLSHAMVGDGLMLLGNYFPTFKNILYFIVTGYNVTSNGWFKEEKVIHFETKYLSPVQSNPNPTEKEVCVSKAVYFKKEFMFPIQLTNVNPKSAIPRNPWSPWSCAQI